MSPLSHILNHFSLQAAKWSSSVLITLLIVWLAVLGCIYSSILTQPFERRQRIFWLLAVTLLPIIGVLTYLPFAFRKEELPHIFLRKSKRPRKARPDNPVADE